jgi:hypothetical protein
VLANDAGGSEDYVRQPTLAPNPSGDRLQPGDTLPCAAHSNQAGFAAAQSQLSLVVHFHRFVGFALRVRALSKLSHRFSVTAYNDLTV